MPYMFLDTPDVKKIIGSTTRTPVRRRRGVAVKKPLRFAYSRKNYKKGKTFAKSGAQVLERRLSPMTNLNEFAPSPIAPLAQAYQTTFVLGSTIPSAWAGGYTALNGFTYVNGTGNNERVGRYMYLDKSTINMSVHMNAQERLVNPIQFRALIFRSRRAMQPTGIASNPDETLFLDTNGNTFGPGTSGKNFNDLYLQPTNKRDWIFVADKKFTLSPTMAEGTTNTAAWQGKYPNLKTMRFNLQHKVKTAFGSNDEPADYDYRYGIIILAGSVARDQIASGWEVNFRGSTCAIDG